MLASALIYLLAAVIAVPIAARLGLGSVIGYLIAGVAIGPFALGLVGDQTEVMHFAEFGVVMMLFLVGLELQPRRLWQMRKPILGLGGLQVIVTAVLIAGALLVFAPLQWQTSVTIGLTLALSSTAIVLQSLGERGLMNTQAGNNAFSVLLFQDIAVIPILALLPLLALGHHTEAHEAAHHGGELLSHAPAWSHAFISVGTIVAIILAGRFLASPLFRLVASTGITELFTAVALLTVIAIAYAMQLVGLSAALGTFLAGVVLAESEFRHELEVDINPFKGLLLGLFFITVGASVNFDIIVEEPTVILLCVVALIAIKGLVLAALAKMFAMTKQYGALFAVALAQGGEFAFVLVSAASGFNIFDARVGGIVTVVVAISMLISPIMLVIYEFVYSRAQGEQEKEADDINECAQVIVAGFGRFGQIVGRMLLAQGYRVTILDQSPSQVEVVRRFGGEIYYGDASRKDLLHAAGAEEATLLVVATDTQENTTAIVHTAKKHFPHIKIMARAFDRRHAYELINSGVDAIERETFHSALRLGISAMTTMGIDVNEAEAAAERFEAHDNESMQILAKKWGDEQSYTEAIKQRMLDLNDVLVADSRQNNAAERE